jgi:hypothetical protein
MSAERTYDIVIFGATGFTGGLVADRLASRAPMGLRWALAGRNPDKLKAVRERLADPDAPIPDILQVESSDEEALARLAESTRVLVTTVGPYLGRGEPLAEACAWAGTDYLDLTGNSITDITALSGLTNLEELVLGSNSITDIGALSGLTSLTVLRLFNNSITDISGLSELTGLTNLDVRLNSISDISGLRGLKSLTALTLYHNSITDIGALSGLTDLGDVEGPFFRPGPDLNLSNNPNLITIRPLLENTGLGAGDTVNLSDVNPAMSCADVVRLQAKGVTVIFNVCT